MTKDLSVCYSRTFYRIVKVGEGGAESLEGSAQPSGVKQFKLQNVALDSTINLVKLEAENTGIPIGIGIATASISNEQIG